MNVANAKTVLLGIYNRFWAHRDIGYPAALEIVNKWIEQGSASNLHSDPAKAIREMEIVFMSVELDLAVELYNQDYVAPASIEKEMILGKED